MFLGLNRGDYKKTPLPSGHPPCQGGLIPADSDYLDSITAANDSAASLFSTENTCLTGLKSVVFVYQKTAVTQSDKEQA